jgi:hypothetical protein
VPSYWRDRLRGQEAHGLGAKVIAMPERVLAAAGLFAAATFCLSYIIPAAVPSPGWLLFPFGRVDGTVTWTFGRLDTVFGGFGLVLMIGLAGFAVLALAGAFLATFDLWIDPQHWRTLVMVGTTLSAVLFVLHLGPWAVLPLVLDGVLFWVAWTGAWAPVAIGAA